MFGLSIHVTPAGDTMMRTKTAAYLMKAEGGCFGYVNWECF